MKKKNTFSTLLLMALAATAQAQESPERWSSSMYLMPEAKADVTLPFSASAEGKRFEPTWGLDLAWINEGNMMRGVNHMGKENVGIGRIAFRFTEPLVNDSALAASVSKVLKERTTMFNKVSTTLPLTFTADQEAGTNEYYVVNKSAKVDHWAAMINSHVHWVQQYTKHPVAGISPFNEGDYWSNEEGGSPDKQWQVAKLLKENYPRCKDIPIVGGNTLNDDKAMDWYTPGKQYYDWGNTHQLAGSFDNFANFFQQLVKDGKVGYADEMHNVGEAMVGLEYGMTVGIWWGFDSRARGEFCQISRHGSRLAYGEHRDNWTAASVYRNDENQQVKAFIGSSERQAKTTSYQFISLDDIVYYDGKGPYRELRMEVPGGTGYQTGQTNAECVIDITSGEDVAPGVINGTYLIMNRNNRQVISVTNDGKLALQIKAAGNTSQQWEITPVPARVGGDFSFYHVKLASGMRMNVLNHSTATGAEIIPYNANGDINEQWYLEYAGNGYYYIRNRESALYLTTANTNSGASLIQNKLAANATTRQKQQQWHIIPIDANCDTSAPAVPTGLSATPAAASVKLQWNANTEGDLEGYMLLRADKATGKWNTIARKLKGTWFVDNTCLAGHEYQYKLKAIDYSDNISAASAAVDARPTGSPSLIARWDMEDNLQDATGNMMDAASYGSPSFNATYFKTGSKSLLIKDGYVQLPYEVAATPELTIAMWVYWQRPASKNTWMRLFDFGNGTDNYMFLTPDCGSGMRFAIKNGGAEEHIDCSSRLANSAWKHVAVSIGRSQTTIYVDGEVAAQGSLSISPADVHPLLNYLGRSQFNSDPYLRGYVDDVQIYNYALNAEQVKQTMNGIVDDFVLGDVNGDGKVDVSDYIGVANNILGIAQDKFNEQAADVNADGKIDVSDYLGIGNIIHTGSPY